MELSDLRFFVAVVREGGVTKAAERLNRVQSNVTTRIRHLEERLGTQLFDRRGRRMVLTPDGHVLLGYADRLLGLAAEAETAMQGDVPRGLLCIGAMESTAAVRLPAPLAAYGEAYPEVTLELRTGNPVQLATDLLAGRIETAFVSEPVAAAKFDSITAFEEEIVIVTSQDHPEFSNGEVPDTVIVFEDGCPHRKRLEEWFEKRDELPRRRIELGSYHAMLGCVLAGMGAALVPKSVISTFPENARLRVTDLDDGKRRLRTMMIWPKGTSSPRVRALSGLIAEGRSRANQMPA